MDELWEGATTAQKLKARTYFKDHVMGKKPEPAAEPKRTPTPPPAGEAKKSPATAAKKKPLPKPAGGKPLPRPGGKSLPPRKDTGKDMPEDFDALMELAKAGNEDAVITLAKMYEKGKGREDAENQVRLLVVCAAEKNPEAQVVLARLSEKGVLVTQSDESAIMYYEKAAESGMPEAFFRLGLMMLSGKKYTAAIEKFRAAHEKAYPTSQFFLAKALILYANSLSSKSKSSPETIQKSYVEAAELLKDDKSKQGKLFLGQLYVKGSGVEKNVDLGLSMLKEALDGGLTSAAFHIGQALMEQKKNDEAASFFAITASEVNDENRPEAAYLLGKLTDQGCKSSKSAFKKAAEYYTTAAKLGHVKASYQLAVILFNGGYAKPDHQLAVHYLAKAAEGNFLPACLALAWCYKYGTGVDKADSLMCENFLRLSKQKELFPDVNFKIAFAVLKIIPRSPAEANTIIHDPKCVYVQPDDRKKIGEAFEKGRYEKANMKEAAAQYKMGCDAGSEKCYAAYAHCLETGKGVEKDKKLAGQYYAKAAGSDGNACYAIASKMYRSDPARCVKLLEDGAAMKHQKCEGMLANIYFNGECGKEVDYDAAYDHFEAACGHDKPRGDALFGLGMCKKNGLGCEVDVEASVPLFKKAADQKYVPAYYMLGTHFKDTNNAQEAFKYFEKGAKADNVPCMVALGDALRYGSGTTRSFTEAHKWYEKAYELGSPRAAHCLGEMYSEGQGVSPDLERAFKYYEYGAEHFETASLLTIANCYLQGKGTAVDFTKAIFYLEIGVKLRDKVCLSYLMMCYQTGLGVTADADVAMALQKMLLNLAK